MNPDPHFVLGTSVAALVGIVFLLCGSGQPFVAATFDLDDDPQPTIINVINATPQASVCGQPTNATQLASNATVCGVAVPRPEFLRQFANAGELLRFNCQNPSRRKCRGGHRHNHNVA